MCCRINPTNAVNRVLAGGFIFLLAFVLGFAGAKVFFWTTEGEVPSDVPVPEIYSSDLFKGVIDEDVADQEEEIEALQPVIDKWLSGRRLEQSEELSGDAAEFTGFFRALPQLVDVNGDGTKELALRTGCAAVGNCEFFLLQKDKSPKGYRILLNESVVQTLKLLKTGSNGYSDLEAGSHGSASSGGIARFKFDGSSYQYSKCFGYEYQVRGVDKRGYDIMSNKPKLTPADCSDWP